LLQVRRKSDDHGSNPIGFNGIPHDSIFAAPQAFCGILATIRKIQQKLGILYTKGDNER
jgi:hypothetical protein